MAGGRKGKPAAPPPPTCTLVVDNGAYTIKAGFAGDLGSDNTPLAIPNCIARDRQRRTYIGSELTARCRDYGEATFRRPVEKGYIVNWEAQRAIWAHEFGEDAEGYDGRLKCDPTETRLLLTEQPNALPALQANCDQMVFEEFRFASYYRGTAAQFNAYLDLNSSSDLTPTTTAEPMPVDSLANSTTETKTEDAAACSTQQPKAPTTTATGAAEIRLVIDAGYSFTTVAPVLHGRPIHRAVRRLDVGGKLLTNYLTKLLSVRHYDMRHDTYIVNEMKEKACYVALDFAADLDKTWKGPRVNVSEVNDAKRRRLDVFRSGSDGIAKEYVLPDYHTRTAGIVRDYDAAAAAQRTRRGGPAADGLGGTPGASAEDVLVLRNERFTVPELLFNPADIGLQQPGLADLVAQSVHALPVGLWPALLANIVVIGGCAELPGFVQRLQQEIQTRMPDDLVVRVTRPADPMTCTWRGAARFASLPENAAVVNQVCITKQEYDEHGAGWVARRFAAGLGGID
ncbi:Actin-related protein 6 [Sporothrix eucalyptigena]|uniref:Actin-related protein 6 n=1 Tax=Sporothrix eucalyptigena TaxID=1812306 RepID=A0ABP0C048_9PEZI